MLLGRYKGRQTYIQGVEDANGTMDAGLRWDFLKKKLSLSARLTDVFDTFSSKTHATIDAGNGALQRELRELRDEGILHVAFVQVLILPPLPL